MNVVRLLSVAVLASAFVGDAVAGDEAPFRLGVIGLDTSHVIAFTDYLNNPANDAGCKVVAAFRGGSPQVASSANRIDGFAEQMREKFGVKLVDSIEALCKEVDGVLLESVDGRQHLSQAQLVLAAKKPVFIDKPIGGSLADAVEIFRLAQMAGVPCWSSSTWRFTDGVQEVRKGKAGKVIGCVAYGPCAIEPYMPDLYWYGIHTAEALFAVMGRGCETVTRTTSDQADVVVGRWKDGRIGTFRGGRHANTGEGILVFGSERVYQAGHDGGYPVLLKEIVKFFKTGQAPVSPEETLEIFAFMSAADESKAQGGRPVALQAVLDRARADVDTRLAAAPTASQNGTNNQSNQKLRIAFVGAHCDDNELGAGGLMRLLADQGHEVISAYGTTFRRGRLVDGKPEDTVRRAESTRACELLGAAPYFFSYSHEELEAPFADKPVLTEMIAWINRTQPDIVVTHWPLDTHPNHHSVAAAVMMAYKHSGRAWGQAVQSAATRSKDWNLYFYEVNNFTAWDDVETLGFHPELYLDVGPTLDAKRRAIDCFASQSAASLWQVHEKMQLTRGAECGAVRAEAYVLLETKPACPKLPVMFLKRK